MDADVLAVRTVSKGLRIAHVKVGQVFGDVPAGADVEAGAAAMLKVTLVSREGRLGASVKVERKQ